jgi:hypothetical protein
MQLPRGTFREIRKGVAVESLLHDLDGEKFSGVANISSTSLTGTLVFKTGKCILVKIQNSRGDTGWDELMKVVNEDVDAALSLLGDAQIELALEFNKPCRLLKSVKSAPSQAAPQRPAPSVSRATAPVQKPAVSAAPLKPAVKPAPTHYHVPAPQTAPQTAAHAPLHPPPSSKTAAASVPPSPPMPTLRQEAGKTPDADESPEKDHETSSFETDLDTFDTMDFDNVTDKIRTDCKTMIKQLHLDHLMER